MRDFKFVFIFKPKYEMRDSSILLDCLHFCIIMKNQLIFVKSCIYTALSQLSCYFMVLQVERRLCTTSRGTGFQ